MTIVAAIDRSDEAEWVVKEARALADAFGDDLHVVHVLSQSEFRDLEETNVQETGKSAGQEEAKSIAAEMAGDIANQFDGEFTSVGLVGEASENIVRYAREQDARYTVIGGRKRTPIGKVVFGSVTQSVLLNTDRSVMTVMHSEE